MGHNPEVGRRQRIARKSFFDGIERRANKGEDVEITLREPRKGKNDITVTELQQWLDHPEQEWLGYTITRSKRFFRIRKLCERRKAA